MTASLSVCKLINGNLRYGGQCHRRRRHLAATQGSLRLPQLQSESSPLGPLSSPLSPDSPCHHHRDSCGVVSWKEGGGTGKKGFL